jgi:hypothetical protein
MINIFLDVQISTDVLMFCCCSLNLSLFFVTELLPARECCGWKFAINNFTLGLAFQVFGLIEMFAITYSFPIFAICDLVV